MNLEYDIVNMGNKADQILIYIYSHGDHYDLLMDFEGSFFRTEPNKNGTLFQQTKTATKPLIVNHHQN